MSREYAQNRVLERREALQRRQDPEGQPLEGQPFDPTNPEGPGPQVCLSPAYDGSREHPAKRSGGPELVAVTLGLALAALVSCVLLR